MAEKAHKLITGSLLRQVAWLLNIAVSFFMMPFLVHSLGDRWYGFWTLVTMFVGYYGFLDLGLATAVSRFIARAVGRDDDEELNVVMSTSFGLYAIIASIAFILTLVIIAAAPFFITDHAEIASFRIAILLMGIAFSVKILFSVFRGVLTAHLRYDLMTYAELVRVIVRTAAIVLLIRSGAGVVGLAAATSFFSIAEFVSYYFFVRSVHPSFSISKKYFRRERIRELYNYGTLSFISRLADHLRFNVDNLVISAFVGVNAVTLYAIPLRLTNYFMTAILNIIGTVTPVFSEYEGRNDFDAIREKFFFMTKISTILTVSSGVAIICVGYPFILRWMGEAYIDAYILLVVLTVSFIVMLIQVPSNSALLGIAKHGYYAIANIIEGVLNLALSLILVRYYGVMGVALGTAIPLVFMRIFIQPVYVCRILQVSLFRYATQVLSVSLLVLLVQGGVYWMVKSLLSPHYGWLFLWGGVFFVVPMIVSFFCVLTKKEKSYFFQFAGKILRRKATA